ncbi:MAG: hypothetical protein OXI25_00125, partial [Chloroflexota bacterium]|nr:hypothetical protein [Chloroflexota bacterium]
NVGRVYRERVFNLPVDGSRQTRGAPVQGIININRDERVTAIVAIREPNADRYIVMATRRGEVKRMHLSQFANIRANGLAAMDLEKGDALLTARLADPDMSVIMVSRGGKGAQFSLDSVRVRQTRSAGGVRGMKLVGDDEVIGMDVAHPEDQLLLLSEKGYGKRTGVALFRTTERGAQGVIALNINEKTGPMAAAVVISQGVEEVMVGSAKAMVYRTRIKEIRSLGRATQGVKVMTKLHDDDQVISISAFKTGEFEDDDTELPVLDAPKVERRKNGHHKPKRSPARAEQPASKDEPDPLDEPEPPPASGGQPQFALDMDADADEDD